MEDIDLELLEGEEILWKKVKSKNLIEKPVYNLLLGLIFIAFVSLGGNFLINFIFFPTLISILSMVLFPLGVLTIIGIVFIRPLILRLSKISRDLGLTFKELQHYQEIEIISNKRLIKKSYDAFEIDYSQNPITDLNGYQLSKDLVYIDLSAINTVLVEKIDEGWQIGFKFKGKDDYLVPLLFFVPLKEFSIFISILKENIPLKTKRHLNNDLIGYYKNDIDEIKE
ncbi:MAG: hypothetical protein JW891_03025 [Candidatus Lokiarchaeota archaeon]|nr:hypothetical protein [Candidatus Lokiarchaeota archaeon]